MPIVIQNNMNMIADRINDNNGEVGGGGDGVKNDSRDFHAKHFFSAFITELSFALLSLSLSLSNFIFFGLFFFKYVTNIFCAMNSTCLLLFI